MKNVVFAGMLATGFALFVGTVATIATVPKTSCAAYWAAHPAQNHHTFNRSHHVHAKCVR